MKAREVQKRGVAAPEIIDQIGRREDYAVRLGEHSHYLSKKHSIAILWRD